MPRRERIINYYSSNDYLVERQFSIEAYTKNIKHNIATDQCESILAEIREFYRNTIGLDGKSFDVVLPDENYYEEEVGGQFVVGMNLIANAISEESVATVEDGENPTIDATFDEVDGVAALLEYYNGSAMNANARSLKEVRGLYKDHSSQRLETPAIMVTEDFATRARTYRGADTLTKRFNVDVYTKLLDRSSSLHQLLRIVDKVKHIIQLNIFKNRLLDDSLKIVNHALEDITIQPGMYGDFPVYRGRVTFRLERRELTPIG